MNDNHDIGKYDTTANFESKLKPGEPWFVIRGQDKLAPAAIEAYMVLMRKNGLPEQDIRSVGLLLERVIAWQSVNPTKLPD